MTMPKKNNFSNSYTKERPISLLADKLQIKAILPGQSDHEKFEALAGYINNLIQTDFNKLLGILYRIDVAEEKIRKVLAENKGHIPIGMIIV